MNGDTVRALNRVNREFYERSAPAFCASRRGVWRGWRRLYELFLAERDSVASPRVLDAGCGNARFVELLAAHQNRPFHYLGVDASAALLEDAANRDAAPGAASFLRLDLVNESLSTALCGRRFDLVVALGLMHHVPGLATRMRLLAELYELLADGGMLAVSFWDFRRVERLRARIVHWQRLARAGGPRIDPGSLESGDHLLGFGDDEDALRYCHFASLEERQHLIGGLPLRAVREYRADGKEGDLNHYFVGMRGS